MINNSNYFSPVPQVRGFFVRKKTHYTSVCFIIHLTIWQRQTKKNFPFLV
nr:MAG TPA: hypothetical protein [Caudoviricetes sp.]